MSVKYFFPPRNTAALLLTLILILTACSSKKPDQPAKKPAAPVLTGIAGERTVPVQVSAIGTVEPIATVAVKSQVNGQLAKVHFSEGQEVLKGALLFTIDPRPFEAQIRQAEAALAGSTAQMEHAREEARRYEELVKKGYISRDQYEQVRTNALALDATVQADRAVVENAKLQLNYCYIHAPITGRLGSLLANEGNLIKANSDTPMVTINQIRPIYVTFSLPEKDLLRIRDRLSGGSVKVEAKIAGDTGPAEDGQISFLDNTVDPATATIRLKGTFANSGKRLWPGQFVTVLITLSEIVDAVVVPAQAIQTGQQGQFVFVIKDNTAELRQVTAGTVYGEMTVIEKGLEQGEVVVVDGQMRLVPGAKVEVQKSGEKPASAPAAAGQGANR